MNTQETDARHPMYEEAYVSFLREDFESSIRFLQQLSSDFPRRGEYSNDLAICCYLAGDKNRSREILLQATKRQGKRSAPGINLAYLFDPARFPEPRNMLHGHGYQIPDRQPDVSGLFLSIIILEYNNPGLTRNCLQSLLATTGEIPYEVILIDNSDAPQHSNALTSLEIPNLFYRKNEVNRGYAAGCNQGAAHARGHYLYFVNNDILFRPGCMEELAHVLLSDKKAGIVGSKLLYEDGSVQHAGIIFEAFTSDTKHRGRHHPADDPFLDIPVKLQAVTAASMMIRRELFQALGGFSEEYRNGYEDVDLCLRALQAGYDVVYNPRSVLTHLESKSEGRFLWEQENLERFRARWRDHVVSDELEILSRKDLFLQGFTEDPRTQRRRKQLYALVDSLGRNHPRVLESIPLYWLEKVKRFRIQKACAFLFDELVRQGEREGAAALYRYFRTRYVHQRKYLRHMRSRLRTG